MSLSDHALSQKPRKRVPGEPLGSIAAKVRGGRLHEVHDLELSMAPMDDLMALIATLSEAQAEDIKRNQLRFYEPASPQAAKIHFQTARTVGVGGGNGSSKTETSLVEMCIRATGIVPEWMKRNVDPHIVKAKHRGPINCRVVCESLTNTLYGTILPKLQFWTWTGDSAPGGDRGHWGWIPQGHLINSSWEASWSDKLRTLTFRYRDPDTGKFTGNSKIQFMSRDQDASDFASGDYHFILHDEPPTYAIWRENQARRMRVSGTAMLAMTWPDDPAISVDWIFDEVYEPGRRGDNPNIVWLDLWTDKNRYLNQESVKVQASEWSETTRSVRLRGQPIRFSNRIHPLFTDEPRWWCFPCGKIVMPVDGRCDCGDDQISAFCHVKPFGPNPSWPTVHLLDPHPRKPHMWAHIQIDPKDDWWMVSEGEKLDGAPLEVRHQVMDEEAALGLNIRQRIMDPNMGRSPSSASKRELTWQDEFANAGLTFDLADDSGVGIKRVNEALQPDERTLEPRLHIAEGCHNARAQMLRYSWDEHKTPDKAPKQTPRDKYDDYPTLLKYLANRAPTYRELMQGPVRTTRWVGYQRRRA